MPKNSQDLVKNSKNARKAEFSSTIRKIQMIKNNPKLDVNKHFKIEKYMFDNIPCEFCGMKINRRGMGSHKNFCSKNPNRKNPNLKNPNHKMSDRSHMKLIKKEPNLEFVNCEPDVETVLNRPDINLMKSEPDSVKIKIEPDIETFDLSSSFRAFDEAETL